MPSIVTLKERKAHALVRRKAAQARLEVRLAALAAQYGGCYRLYGSAARGAMRPDSDVDLLAEFPGHSISDAIRAAEGRLRRTGPALRYRRSGLVQRSFPGACVARRQGPRMSDARWIEIEGDFETACTHFAGAVRLFDAGGFEGEAESTSYKASMALMHAMQSGHTSLEVRSLEDSRLLSAKNARKESPGTGTFCAGYAGRSEGGKPSCRRTSANMQTKPVVSAMLQRGATTISGPTRQESPLRRRESSQSACRNACGISGTG